jgi:predicted DNA-binding transcriptional regulator AlpA
MTTNDNQSTEYVDDRELAARTPIARITWQTWRSKGKGPPYYQVGRRCLYRWTEVLAWLESLKVAPKRPAKPSARKAS